MMELIALMACHYIETFELEMYLNLFKINNPPLVRELLIMQFILNVFFNYDINFDLEFITFTINLFA